MQRIFLFLATNMAVIVVAGVVLQVLGVDGFLQQSGTGLDLTALLIFSAVFGFTGSIISLLMSKTMAKMSAKVQVITQPRTQDEQWLVQTVEALARDAGIGRPEIGIFPANQANAFATGWSKNNSLVAVSSGLLQRFDRDAARAVLAHEVGHIANGDMVTLSLIQGVVNTFVIFVSRVVGTLVDRTLSKNNRGSGLGVGYYATVFVAQIVFGVAASAIVMWFSRWREFHADAAGARLAGRHNMIAALRRLQAEVETPNALPESLTAFGISQGAGRKLGQWFSSHPPLEKRIEALEKAQY